MKFLLHVIEETSIHKKEEEEYIIQECAVSEEETAHILIGDSFYVVEAKEPIDAVIEISNIIRVKDADGDRVKLAALLKKQKEIQDSDPEKADRLVGYIFQYMYSEKTSSDLFSATYEIDLEDSCVELHKVFFYVIKENDIMQIVEK